MSAVFILSMDSDMQERISQRLHPLSTQRLEYIERPVKQIIKYSYYPSEGPFTLVCKNCALVVGSGHMIDAKKGREIDKNDCVLRPNDAPTSGYEPDVGAKTTLRSVDHRSLDFIRKRIQSGRPFDDLHANATLIVFSSRNASDWSEVSNKIIAMKKQHPGMKFVIHENDWMSFIEATFNKEIDNSTENIWISNGFYSLLLLKEICSNISVYGMSDPNYCFQKGNNDVQYHYYFGYTGLECATFMTHAKAKENTHRFLAEKFVYQKWRKEWGNLVFRYPVWPPSNESS